MGSVFAVSLQDGRSRELYSDDAGIGRPLWLPSGDMLLVPHYDRNSRRSKLWTISCPQAQLDSPTPSRITQWIWISRRMGELWVAITNVARSQIWVSSSPDLERVQQLTNGDPPMHEVKANLDENIMSADTAGGLGVSTVSRPCNPAPTRATHLARSWAAPEKPRPNKIQRS